MTNAQNSGAVEAVARAISEYTYALLNPNDAGDCAEWGDMSETARNVYMRAARAAIVAMPTPAPSDQAKLVEACRALDEMWSRDWEPPHVDKNQQEPRLITEECLDIWRNIRAALPTAPTLTAGEGGGDA